MLTGPIPATRRILDRTGLTIDDIDAFEVNEAFDPVPLAWPRSSAPTRTAFNVRGSAIALGHPLGASGTRLLTTLVNTLKDHGWRYGLQPCARAAGWPTQPIIERL